MSTLSSVFFSCQVKISLQINLGTEALFDPCMCEVFQNGSPFLARYNKSVNVTEAPAFFVKRWEKILATATLINYISFFLKLFSHV